MLNFVTRQRKNACYRVIARQAVPAGSSVTSDQTIQVTRCESRAMQQRALYRIGYRDTDNGKHYVFLTNNFRLSARTITAIYMECWQIELFFKWIKQNLKIKTFLGISRFA